MPPLAHGHTAGPGDSARGGHSCHPPPPAAAICHRRGHVVQERGHRAVLGLCPHLWHCGFLSPSAQGHEGTQRGFGVLEAKGTSGTIGDVALRVPVSSGMGTGTQGDTRQFRRPRGHQAALGLCPHLQVAVTSNTGTGILEGERMEKGDIRSTGAVTLRVVVPSGIFGDFGSQGGRERGQRQCWGCGIAGCPLWCGDGAQGGFGGQGVEKGDIRQLWGHAHTCGLLSPPAWGQILEGEGMEKRDIRSVGAVTLWVPVLSGTRTLEANGWCQHLWGEWGRSQFRGDSQPSKATGTLGPCHLPEEGCGSPLPLPPGNSPRERFTTPWE